MSAHVKITPVKYVTWPINHTLEVCVIRCSTLILLAHILVISIKNNLPVNNVVSENHNIRRYQYTRMQRLINPFLSVNWINYKENRGKTWKQISCQLKKIVTEHFARIMSSIYSSMGISGKSLTIFTSIIWASVLVISQFCYRTLSTELSCEMLWLMARLMAGSCRPFFNKLFHLYVDKNMIQKTKIWYH